MKIFDVALGDKNLSPAPVRRILLVFTFLAIYLAAANTPNTWGETEDPASIWGNIAYYTDTYVVVNGKQYNFDSKVVIDTYSLKPDKRGNVRLQLDSYGAVLQLFFYGVDMPEVITRYKR